MQEYTSEEEGSEPDADLENQYYQSKGLKETSPSAAIGSFEKVRRTCPLEATPAATSISCTPAPQAEP